MATYAIYKILFEVDPQKNLISLEDGNTAFDKAQDILEGMLEGSLPVYRKKKNGENILLQCAVEKKMNGVTLMQLCDEKEMKYKEGHEDVEITAHPGCYVIVDNRPGVLQMVVEHVAASFEGKTDKVRDLIEETLNSLFEEYGLTVNINQKWHPGDFWEAIEEQSVRHNDTIRKVVFDFPNPERVGPIDPPNDLAHQKLILLNTLTQATNAAKGSLSLVSDKEKAMRLERTQEDIAGMVALCSNNGYDITVMFENYGKYRKGSDIKAFEVLDDAVIEEFRNGQRSIEGVDGNFLLIQWLDDVREQTKDYNYEKIASKRKKVR